MTTGARTLAPPFSRLFADWSAAEYAFDLLRLTTELLHIDSPHDPRLAVILSTTSLHLDVGGWPIIEFERPGQISLALLTSHVYLDSHFQGQPYATKADEPAICRYTLPFEHLRPFPADLQETYRLTVEFIAQKFANWKRPATWQHHQPDVAAAIFDADHRERLLTIGLPDDTLRYERHFTAFKPAIGEEVAEYEVSGENNMSLDQLAAETHFEPATLQRWLRAIERKKQAILYGPPGTGKTFLAKHLAKYLTAGGEGLVEMVQFHPAYAYEDFIQGLRPQLDDAGRLRYQMIPGRFLTFCQRAKERGQPCVLIIDEINRANLSSVFGELMYLLEYRRQTVKLATTGEEFTIPDEVRLIGTMNTADRSIALVDHALRRRFAFISLQPNFEVLRRYHHTTTDFNLAGLINLLTRLNRTINDPHYEVGITFFLVDHLVDHIADIWHMEIEPYLEELFFNQPQKVNQFRWDQIKGEVLLP